MSTDIIPKNLFQRALELARTAQERDEVPVGALICMRDEFSNWQIIAEGYNQIIELHDPTAHAELLAIKDAAAYLQNERLSDCILISTLEPCLMCSGAAIWARIQSIYYLAPLESGMGLVEVLSFKEPLPGRKKNLNHRPYTELVQGYRPQAEMMLRDFFQNKR